MPSKYLPEITAEAIKEKQQPGKETEYYEILVEPLHEELYRRKDFNFLDELTEGQQLLLSYDYVRMQVIQGGFIQLIQNGYIGLLPPMPNWLYAINAGEMAKVIDDVLKVYVLNHEMLEKETSVEEFAKLYDELKEFEAIDEQFLALNESTLNKILQFATDHIEEFAVVKG
jgi:hypothetical protein